MLKCLQFAALLAKLSFNTGSRADDALVVGLQLEEFAPGLQGDPTKIFARLFEQTGRGNAPLQVARFEVFMKTNESVSLVDQPRCCGVNQPGELLQSFAPGAVEFVLELTNRLSGRAQLAVQPLNRCSHRGGGVLLLRDLGLEKINELEGEERGGCFELLLQPLQLPGLFAVFPPQLFHRSQQLDLSSGSDELLMSGAQVIEVCQQPLNLIAPVVRLEHVFANKGVETLDVFDRYGLVEHIDRFPAHARTPGDPAEILNIRLGRMKADFFQVISHLVRFDESLKNVLQFVIGIRERVDLVV